MIHNTVSRLALTLPGGNTIPAPSGLDKSFVNLGSLISPLLNIAFYAAIFITFYYLIWGAFAYIAAQGNKENLAKARARITWALVGLIVVLLAYFIAQFAGEILKPKGGLLPF